MTTSYPPISAILLAGGRGLRMQSPLQTPKQFLEIHGKPIALYSFETLCAYPRIEEIIVVCEPDYYSLFHAPAGIPLKWAAPGKLRQDSVQNALQCVSGLAHLLCIHDSARPLLVYEDLLRVIEAADTTGAATLAAPVKNTIKECDEQGYVKRTLERSHLWEIYTPQVMRPSLLKRGYAIAKDKGLLATDDMFLIELTGHPVKLVQGQSTNIKVTLAEDLRLVSSLLEQGICS